MKYAKNLIYKVIAFIMCPVIITTALASDALALRPVAYRVSSAGDPNYSYQTTLAENIPRLPVASKISSRFLFKSRAVKIVRSIGWALSFAALIGAVAAIVLCPAIILEYLPVLIQGWIILAGLVTVSLFKDRYLLKLGIMLVIIESILRFMYGVSLLDVSSSIVVRALSVFAGVSIARLISAKESLRETLYSTLQWVISNGIILGYYIYFCHYSFLGGSFTEARFGLWAPLLKASFGITVATGLIIMWLMIIFGAVFGEKKDIIKEPWKVLDSFKQVFPYNFLFWFPISAIAWFFLPDPAVFKYAHAVMAVIWHGIFQEVIRRNFQYPAKKEDESQRVTTTDLNVSKTHQADALPRGASEPFEDPLKKALSEGDYSDRTSQNYSNVYSGAEHGASVQRNYEVLWAIDSAA